VIAPVTDAEFEAKVLSADRPVVVDFWAAWCAPCRMIEPALHSLAAELGGRVLFFKMDIDANTVVPAALGLQAWPTVVIFHQGKPAARQVGYSKGLQHTLGAELAILIG
jgi:thioredoxin 1